MGNVQTDDRELACRVDGMSMITPTQRLYVPYFKDNQGICFT